MSQYQLDSQTRRRGGCLGPIAQVATIIVGFVLFVHGVRAVRSTADPSPPPNVVPAINAVATWLEDNNLPSSAETLRLSFTDLQDDIEEIDRLMGAPPTYTPTEWPTALPTATATRTPTPPLSVTLRPANLHTDPPTRTPIPTETPIPTATPKPSDTPSPTNTPIPAPTNTPIPLGVTFAEICEARGSEMTAPQRERHVAQFIGKQVTWDGWVYDVDPVSHNWDDYAEYSVGSDWKVPVAMHPRSLFWSRQVVIYGLPNAQSEWLEVEQPITISGRIAAIEVFMEDLCNPVVIVDAVLTPR